MKKSLKFTFIALLFVCIIAVPLLGVSFYDSPSIFDENAIIANQKFGGGSSVSLTLDTDDAKINTKENLEKTAKILESRFCDQGYNDAKTTVVDSVIKLDFSEKNLVNSAIASLATIGEWTLTTTDQSAVVLCDKTLVQDAYVSANADGSYAVTLEFSEKGKTEFFANTASLAISGSTLYFKIDGTPLASGSINDATVQDTFTFGQLNYGDAARYVSFIKNGELPATVKVEKVETFKPTLGTTALTLIYVSMALVLSVCIVALVLKGKLSGIFASLALLANVAIFLTALANATVMLNAVTLITISVCIILATVFYFFAVPKTVSSSTMKSLNRFNIKAIWIHAILLIVSLIVSFFARGSLLYIARIALLLSCSNFVLYFIFVYFGIYTLADKK